MLDAAKCMSSKIPQRNRINIGQSWYDTDCQEAKQLSRKALRKYIKSKSVRDKQVYLTKRKEYKHILKKKELDAKLKRLDSLMGSIKLIIHLVSSGRKSETEKVQEKANNINTNNSGDIPAQEWHDHFKTILNENVTVPNDNINPSDSVDDEFLDAPITSSEVKKAINYL